MSLVISGSSSPFKTPKTDFSSSSDEMKPLEKKVYDLSPIISKLETQNFKLRAQWRIEQMLLDSYKFELIKRLPDYRKKIEEIFQIRIKPRENPQSVLLSMRDQCISLFKDLNNPHFFLDLPLKPTYFNTIPYLISLYKRIEETPNATQSDIEQFYEELTICGSFPKAVEVVKKISNEDFQNNAFHHISFNMAACGNAEEIEALRLANSITDIETKEFAFYDIAYQFSTKGKYEYAKMVADVLSDYQKQNVIALIALFLAKRGKLDEALQLIETMTDPHKKDLAYCDITTNETLIDKIQTVSIKDQAISQISLFYAATGKEKDAIRLSGTITDPSKRKSTAWRINVDLASDDTDLEAVVRGLIKQGNLKEALRAAEEIRDSYVRDYVFRDLAIELAMKDQCEAAAALASSISDLMNKDTAFAEISVQFAKKGQLAEAVHLAELITEEMLQGYAYWKISRYLPSEDAAELCNKITHKLYWHMAKT